MRIQNGITVKVNSYDVTGVAVVDGSTNTVKFTTPIRDQKAVKKFIAEKLGVPAARIIVDFKLVKNTITINANIDTLIAALDAAKIEYTNSADNEDVEE